MITRRYLDTGRPDNKKAPFLAVEVERVTSYIKYLVSGHHFRHFLQFVGGGRDSTHQGSGLVR